MSCEATTAGHDDSRWREALAMVIGRDKEDRGTRGEVKRTKDKKEQKGLETVSMVEGMNRSNCRISISISIQQRIQQQQQ